MGKIGYHLLLDKEFFKTIRKYCIDNDTKLSILIKELLKNKIEKK